MQKRFEAIDYDYLSIPDNADFNFPGGSIVFAVEYDGFNTIIKAFEDQRSLEDYLRS